MVEDSKVFIFDGYTSSMFQLGEVYLIGLDVKLDYCFTAHLARATTDDSVHCILKEHDRLSIVYNSIYKSHLSCIRITEIIPEENYFRWDDIAGFTPFASLLNLNGFSNMVIGGPSKH